MGPMDLFGGDVLQHADEDRQKSNMFADALRSPQGQAALLSFGINMLQPGGYGASLPGQIGRSIGAAGEAAQSVSDNQTAEQDAAARHEDRKARLANDQVRADAYAKSVEGKGGVKPQSAAALFSQSQAKKRSFAEFIKAKRGALLSQDEIDNFDNQLTTDTAFQKKIAKEYQALQRLTEDATGTAGSDALAPPTDGEPPGDLPAPAQLPQGVTPDDWALYSQTEQEAWMKHLHSSGN